MPESETIGIRYDQHLMSENLTDNERAQARERYEAFASTVKDILSPQWVKTEETYRRENVKRVYYLYDVPGGSERGGHAHIALHQLIVAPSGSFDVILDDGKNKKTIQLNRPNFGLLVVPGIWREIVNFSSGAICLVLASQKYSAEDYLRDYNEFLQWKSLK